MGGIHLWPLKKQGISVAFITARISHPLAYLFYFSRVEFNLLIIGQMALK